MESLARLVVAATELLEAEGRVLKRHAVRLMVVAGLGFVIIVFLIAALGSLLFSLYTALSALIPPAGAALVCGAVSLLAAWCGFLVARRLTR